jgi:hypothetical protein
MVGGIGSIEGQLMIDRILKASVDEAGRSLGRRLAALPTVMMGGLVRQLQGLDPKGVFGLEIVLILVKPG